MTPDKYGFVEPLDDGDGASPGVSLLLDLDWSTADATWFGAVIDQLVRQASEHAAQSAVGKLSFLSTMQDVAGSVADLKVRRERTLLNILARLFVACEHGQLSDGGLGGLVDWSAVSSSFCRNGLDSARALVDGWPDVFGTAEECKQTLLDFANSSNSSERPPRLVAFMRMLVDTTALKLPTLFEHGYGNTSCDYIQIDGGLGPQFRQWKDVDPAKPPSCEPSSVFSWMLVLGPGALTDCLPRFAEMLSRPLQGVDPEHAGAVRRSLDDDHNQARIIGNIRGFIESWLCATGRSPSSFADAGIELASACRPFSEFVGHKLLSESRDELAVRQWMWLHRCILGADCGVWYSLPEDHRSTVLKKAAEDMASLRPLLAEATPRPLIGRDRDVAYRYGIRYNERPDEIRGTDEELRLLQNPVAETWLEHWPKRPDQENLGPLRSWEQFTWERDHLLTCLHLLYGAGGCWRAIKPSVLAWRALKTRGIARDLRYWNEPDREPVPEIWSDLFAWPISLFHEYAGHEQRSDPELRGLRSEFAGFLLSRLVDRWSAQDRARAEKEGRSRINGDMREPSAAWRYCSIRAFSSLFANPEGKAQRVLRVAASIDPEPSVREAANEAFQRLRRGLPPADAVSPRKAVLSALWWLRQAHLLALDVVPADPGREVIKIDSDGAQRTRAKELNRTKEPRERAHSPDPV